MWGAAGSSAVRGKASGGGADGCWQHSTAPTLIAYTIQLYSLGMAELQQLLTAPFLVLGQNDMQEGMHSAHHRVVRHYDYVHGDCFHG
jgi:hypothetical protein